MTPAPPVLGLDFGTTNTVLAARELDGVVRARRFRHGADVITAFRSVLAFWQEGESLRRDAGPWAMARFIQEPEETRFLQSFKTFAASPLFDQTAIFAQRFRFEDILRSFLDRVRHHTGEGFPARVVVGRPVEFAGASPDAALARARYDAALSALGFTEIHHVLEPVAAAYFYAQRLTTDATVLVGDFGGGTSDFSIIRFERPESGLQAYPLGHAGIGIAGDDFDARLIDQVVAPRLGRNSRYRSGGKLLDMPGTYYSSFARWNEFSLMRSPKILRDLAFLQRSSEAPEQLGDFMALIQSDAVFTLYQAVAEAKAALSDADTAPFQFRSEQVTINAAIARADFERWIARDLARIGEAIDTALDRAGIGFDRIDTVFLTGGTSYVPAVRRLFADRFGTARIESGDQLLSIALGLALIGDDPDITRWTIS